MNYVFTLVLALFIGCSYSIAEGDKTKIEITYTQEGVSVVLNDEHLGEDKRKIKLNFQLGGELIFYKRGYYSKVVQIDPDNIFQNLKVNLEKKKDVSEFQSTRLIYLEELNLGRVITNMTKEEIQHSIEKYFISKNVNVGVNSERFPNGNIDASDAKYTMFLNITDYRQVKSVYTNPRFMLATVDVSYTIKSKETGKVELIETIKGVYLANFRSAKGLIPSKRMVQMMEQAIETTQDKLMKSEKFLSL